MGAVACVCAALVLGGLAGLVSCGGGSSTPTSTVTIATNPGTVAGGATFLFSSTVTNVTSSTAGVSLVLALNEESNGETTTPCTASCGALSDVSTVVSGTSTVDNTTYYNLTTTTLYTAPLDPPSPNSIVLTATSPTSTATTATVTFSVGAPAIEVKIVNKITKILPGAAAVTLDASVKYDPNKRGVSWKIRANGAACSPACGTLSDATATTVKYTPPASIPAAPDNTPTITATSLSDSTETDFDTFTIEGSTLPISVTITNPFTSIEAGTPGVTIHATVTNDTRGQGVTWTILPAAGAGSLSAATATSVLYTPPNLAPQVPNNTPTITATSVADPTKSAMFTFTIEPPGSAVACGISGQWVFTLGEVRPEDGAAGDATHGATSGRSDVLSATGDEARVAGGAVAAEAEASSGGAAMVRPFAALGSMVFDGDEVRITALDVNDDYKVASSGGTIYTAKCLGGTKIAGASTAGGVTAGTKIETFAMMLSEGEEIPGLAAKNEVMLSGERTPVGRFMLHGWSADGEELAGLALPQDVTAFSQFGGQLRLGMTDASNTGAVILGSISVEFSGNTGKITSGHMNETSASAGAANIDTVQSGAVSVPDANGRGTLRFEFGTGSSGGTGEARNFAYYVVSKRLALLMEIDAEADSGIDSSAGAAATRTMQIGSAFSTDLPPVQPEPR
jgi:hypothetical protein